MAAGNPDDRSKASAPSPAARAGELRDTERAIALWEQKAAEFGRPPPAGAFDLALTSERGCRFVLCGDEIVEAATFLAYGPRFARLLDLPERPLSDLSALSQLPGRYLSLFAEGYVEAFAGGKPARFSGAVMHYGMIELYRAAFMPLRLQPKAGVQLIFGSFDYRSGLRAEAADTFSTAANWLHERDLPFQLLPSDLDPDRPQN